MSLDDLNREQKRQLRRMGALDEKGAPTRVQRQAPAKKERVGPAQYLREVRDEDSASLAQSGFQFNLNAIIGGCLGADAEPRLYYVSPEGNWIESAADAPCFVIGRTHYAKPILDRFLRVTTSLPRATALAMLAFDATRRSVTDVDFPVDVAVVAKDSSDVF